MTEQTTATTLQVRGVDVPRIGYGTFELAGAECLDGVRHALQLGYRHVDTARGYGNEAEVGRGIAQSGVPRAEIFLTTKIRPSDLSAGNARASVEGSLRDLRDDYVDLVLIHWPNRSVPLRDSLDTLFKLREEGKTRQVGVSNFPPGLLRQALEQGPILCNQVEYHPFLAQPALLELARDNDLMLTAYGPMARGEVQRDRVLAAIAADHGVTPAQVALAWLVRQPNVAALVRSTDPGNRAANLDVFGIELRDEETARIAALDRGLRLYNPPWAPEWDR
jgi:2,5-diketo-D-gluconate reductase B